MRNFSLLETGRVVLAIFVVSALAPASCTEVRSSDSRDAGALSDSSSEVVLDASADVTYPTMSGPYTCCAPNEGLGCCEGKRPGTCFQYGGIFGTCLNHGSKFDGKIICAHCCEDLTRAEIHETFGDACRSTGPPSVFICVLCGDGVCSPEENRCRCPQDCP
jgi:hypothetical protein